MELLFCGCVYMYVCAFLATVPYIDSLLFACRKQNDATYMSKLQLQANLVYPLLQRLIEEQHHGECDLHASRRHTHTNRQRASC